MDKTDCFTFINGKPAYLKGKTAKTRNKRAIFKKLDTPRDVKFTSRGSGVVHNEQGKGIGRTQYARRRFCHVALTFDTNVGEQILIKRV